HRCDAPRRRRCRTTSRPLESDGTPVRWPIAEANLFKSGICQHLAYWTCRKTVLEPRPESVQGIRPHYVKAAVSVNRQGHGRDFHSELLHKKSAPSQRIIDKSGNELTQPVSETCRHACNNDPQHITKSPDQPRSKPMASVPNSSQGKIRKYSWNRRFSSSSPMGFWSKRLHSSPNPSTVFKSMLRVLLIVRRQDCQPARWQSQVKSTARPIAPDRLLLIIAGLLGGGVITTQAIREARA